MLHRNRLLSPFCYYTIKPQRFYGNRCYSQHILHLAYHRLGNSTLCIQRHIAYKLKINTLKETYVLKLSINPLQSQFPGLSQTWPYNTNNCTKMCICADLLRTRCASVAHLTGTFFWMKCHAPLHKNVWIG